MAVLNPQIKLFEIKDRCLLKYYGTEEEVFIPDEVEEIATESFAWCSNLKRIAGGKNVHTVGKDAFLGTPFYRFYSENETEWEEDYIYIGSCLLAARRNIRTAHIPEGTTMIAADAFRERVLLKEVTFPSSLVYIDWRAFVDCFSLTKLTIPGNVKKLGWHCFKGCKRVKEIWLEEGVEIIENGVFSECRSLRYITFPKSLVKLGGWMFFGCANLEEVRFLGDLEEFHERTFSECSNLHKVNFPKGLKRIGPDCFYNCTNIQRVDFPEGLKSIGKSAFVGDKFFEELILPNSLTSIGTGAFTGCWGIKELVIPGNLLVIEDYVFLDCEKLEKVTVHEGVMSIGNSAFANCRNLKEAVLPNTVTSLGREAFAGCARLEKVQMPANVDSIGADLFKKCNKLSDENGFYIIDHICYGYYGPDTVLIIPDGTREAADGAFRDNDKYIQIKLPKSVTKIGKNSFGGCGHLLSIVAPGVAFSDWNEENCVNAVIGYCEAYKEYEKENAACFAHWIRDNKALLLKKGIDLQLSYIVHYFTSFHLIELKYFYEILEYAQKKKAMEPVALLLEYRNKMEEEADLFDKYSLD